MEANSRKERIKADIKIALAGNPNCGKTTLFNALTGSSQYVGSWPGVTVEKKEGRLPLGGSPWAAASAFFIGIAAVAVIGSAVAWIFCPLGWTGDMAWKAALAGILYLLLRKGYQGEERPRRLYSPAAAQ